MKILTGDLRGRVISYKHNPYIRPTSDKARKAIFDMLQGTLENKNVLDLFSGTGALGFEAFSQGADSVTFVELERSQAEAIDAGANGITVQFTPPDVESGYGLYERGFKKRYLVYLEKAEQVARETSLSLGLQ